jgi:hypothetical protein
MNKQAFTNLIGKQVKVVYKEYSSVQIGKGVLTELSDKFLTLDGSFSIQVIPVDSIIKVSCLKHDKEEDHDGNRKT